jgi:hypothetical protein
LGSAGINISEVWQLSHPVDELQRLAQSYGIVSGPALMLPFVITLEQTSLAQLRVALKSIGAKEFNLVPPVWIPIWKSS